jgi:fluoroacetyl-CoA thioesterase
VSSKARAPGLAPGLSGTCRAVVGPSDTSRAAGTGDLDLLATARVLALLEQAALDALGDVLGSTLTTVGVRVELEHLLPTGIGETVIASASLISVRGKRLVFAVKLHDSHGRALGVGRLTRGLIERAELEAAAQ